MRGSIGGYVVSAGEGYPIAGATVDARGPGSIGDMDIAWVNGPNAPPLDTSTVTDEAGRFVLDRLIEGEWTLRASDPDSALGGRETIYVFDNSMSDVTIELLGENVSGGSRWRDGAVAPIDRAMPGSGSVPEGPPTMRRTVKVPDAYAPFVGTEFVHIGNDYVLRLGSGISILRRDGGYADATDLTVGRVVSVWVTGSVLDSSPGQVVSAIVVIEPDFVGDGWPRPGVEEPVTDPREYGMKGNVLGRVIRWDDGSPLADATITVVRGAGPAPDIAPMTDKAGRFAMDELPAGDWLLRAIGPDGELGETTIRVSAGATAKVTISV